MESVGSGHHNAPSRVLISASAPAAAAMGAIRQRVVVVAFGRDGHAYRFTTPLSNEANKPQYSVDENGCVKVSCFVPFSFYMYFCGLVVELNRLQLRRAAVLPSSESFLLYLCSSDMVHTFATKINVTPLVDSRSIEMKLTRTHIV